MNKKRKEIIIKNHEFRTKQRYYLYIWFRFISFYCVDETLKNHREVNEKICPSEYAVKNWFLFCDKSRFLQHDIRNGCTLVDSLKQFWQYYIASRWGLNK